MSEAKKAVFLSYASQDAEAARRVCEALRAAGVEVWFDQSELRGGDAWDAKIRKQIKECALFVPVISANTQARTEGYFRLEWRLADQRTHLMGKSRPFLVPVCIDDTRDEHADVPDSFVAVQWMRLGTDASADAFCARVKALLAFDGGTKRPPSPTRQELSEAPTSRPPHVIGQRRSIRQILALFGVAVTLSIGLWLWLGQRPSEVSVAQTPRGIAPAASPSVSQTTRSSRPEVAALLERVRVLTDKTDVVRAELDTASGLLDQAAKLDSANANVWAAWALLDRRYTTEWYDRSPARFDALQRHATQAFSLAPANPAARLVRAVAMTTHNRDRAARTEAIQLVESITGAPDVDPAALVLLAWLKRSRAQPEAGFGYLERAEQTPGWTGRVAFERAWSYGMAGEWERSLEAVDRGLAVERSTALRLFKSYVLTVWRGDTATALQLTADIPAAIRSEDFPASARYWVCLWARDYDGAYEALRRVPRDYIESTALVGPIGYYRGYVLERAGKASAAKVEWQSALEVVNRRLAAQSNDRTLLEFKAVLTHALGDAATAQAIWRSVDELFGEEFDSWTNYFTAMTLLPEDVAIDRLSGAVKRRDVIGLATNLRLSPHLDRLRANPRFIALLAEAEADPRMSPKAKVSGRSDGTAKEATANKSASAEKSVAVLAFENVSDDKANEYFADGISEELLNALGKVPGLKVTARTSAFFFKGKNLPIPKIAEQLGVAYVVEGTVRKSGSQVRVAARLINGATSAQVWTGDFREEWRDGFALQDKIAGEIAQNLQLKLGAGSAPARPGIHPEAYRLYLEGRDAWNLRTLAGYERAESSFNQAIEFEPRFARAHAAIADVWVLREMDAATAGRFSDRASPAVARFVGKARQAVALDPESAEAHASLGHALGIAWEFEEARRELERALALNPNYASAHQWLGRVLCKVGYADESLAALQRAADLDPLSHRILDNLASQLLDMGRPQEAWTVIEKARVLNPDGVQVNCVRLLILTALGSREQALAAARALVGKTQLPIGERLGEIVETLLAFGADAEAQALMRNRSWRAFDVFTSDLLQGRPDDAVKNLDQIAANGLEALLFRSIYDPLRGRSEFQAWLKQVGLAEAHARAQRWRAANPPQKVEAKK